MTYEQRKQERQALIGHLLTQDWNVFGTLKFVSGRAIGRSSADKLLRSYLNKMDRVMFGKAAERQNMRVPRWCFAHEGSDHENYHVHFVMKSAPNITESMCCLLNAVWAQHHAQTVGSFGEVDSKIPCQSQSFWVGREQPIFIKKFQCSGLFYWGCFSSLIFRKHSCFCPSQRTGPVTATRGFDLHDLRIVH